MKMRMSLFEKLVCFFFFIKKLISESCVQYSPSPYMPYTALVDVGNLRKTKT